MPDTAVTVIGAGVVGLAVAARLAPRCPDLVLLESAERHGTGQSSRNSEVIHAGMYYPTGSLKARLCVEGNAQLYAFCARHRVAHRRIGKLIVAVADAQHEALAALFARGLENGVDLRALAGVEARALEPNVPAVEALFSPNTGIVSAHELMDALLSRARADGAVPQFRVELQELAPTGDGWRVTFRRGTETESFTSEWVVNAAGLGSEAVAALAGVDVDAAGYRIHPCKGDYFAVAPAKSALVSHLVYPLPDHVSLGVHAVVGLDGRLRFGPDAVYVGRDHGYAVDEAKRPAFGSAVRKLVPAIRDEDLTPDLSGIRAKLQGPGEGFRDFVIADEGARGLPGLIDLVGIDSPGLTSSLAIADEVARILNVG
ncbi:MAG: NAD(P)/FAD-dependent oxidoreductase [Vicinamibacteria bacterium]